jgi:hypothetical protein
LEPVGIALPHEVILEDGMVVMNGLYVPGIMVPGVPGDEYAAVKFVAWDSRLWGETFDSVPMEFLGMTDTIRLLLRHENAQPPRPVTTFTRGAVVPVIPEPSSTWLFLIGGIVLIFHCVARRDLSLK